ncbi:LysR family transcriptional regulator [Paraburkholderia sp. Ac-20342]|uniref:LysR substrate-binding domain-containing protein n=1 Tax=Paraburkholderia sp. Ac-20342 TaxID=2703889 RepID=UPI00197D5971|nr:LysR substrate-binding domain-containing protein [Paraburkholderia sp. Ac-20342]MBN3851410.1 LysR family transcriptional regulator [Paraburkholderia sp. Ac-20342]
MTITLAQLNCIRQVVNNQFSVSRTAEMLFTTQPGVSKMIRALESELGIVIFLRRGNRLIGLTDEGREAYALARRMLQDARALQQLHTNANSSEIVGVLRVGTTHIHARYRLPAITERFLRAYPKVQIEYSMGAPSEIYFGVRDGTIDIGLSTVPENTLSRILAIRAYEMERCLIVPTGHPLLDVETITFEELVKWPWVVHDERFTSGAIVHRAFQMHGMLPNIAIRVMDASVVKAYVAQGIGISVVQKMAMEDETDGRLKQIDVSHMFPSPSAMVTVCADHLLKVFAFDFIRLLLPGYPAETLAAQLPNGDELLSRSFLQRHD